MKIESKEKDLGTLFYGYGWGIGNGDGLSLLDLDADGWRVESRAVDGSNGLAESKEGTLKHQGSSSISVDGDVVGGALLGLLGVPVGVDTQVKRRDNTGVDSVNTEDLETQVQRGNNVHSESDEGRLAGTLGRGSRDGTKDGVSSIGASGSKSLGVRSEVEGVVMALDLESLAGVGDELGGAGEGAGTELDLGLAGEATVPVDGPGARGGTASVEQEVFGGLDENVQRDGTGDSNVGTEVKDTGDRESKQGDGGNDGESRSGDVDTGQSQHGVGWAVDGVGATTVLLLDVDASRVVDLGGAGDLGAGDAPVEAVDLSGEDVLDAGLLPGHVSLGYSFETNG